MKRAFAVALAGVVCVGALAWTRLVFAGTLGREPSTDPRIRTVVYSPDSVVTVPVRRGMVTQIVLADDETVTTQPAMGKGADCARETDTWCVVASGQDVFIKPKTGATTNNMVLVSTRGRRYAFEF